MLLRSHAATTGLLLLLAPVAADPRPSRPRLAASRVAVDAPACQPTDQLVAAVAKAPAPAAVDDTGPIVLLLLLYTLQGIPMGLGASLPMLMLERGVSTMEMAVFSIVAFPFAIKLFWAPLVDSIYSARVGRRKTWIVPMQGVIGLLMVFAGGRVDTLLGPVGGPEPVDVRALTKLFLAFYVLAATQDIAVDGLALTVLSAPNRELGATCNAIGQTLGTFLAYVGFILLHARGLTTLGHFMRWWGIAFLVSIAPVLLMARQDEHRPPRGGVVAAAVATYREMGTVLLLPSVRQLALVLLTARVPFAAVDTLLPLELQRNGFKKSQLALLSTALLPISMTAQAVVSGFFRSGATPLRVFVFAIGARLVQGFLAVGLVAWLRAATRGGAPPPLAVYAAGLLVLSLGALVHAAMFVAQMAFFNRVSDPRIGGTYLTMLNTLANLGSQWPATVVLAVAGSIERSPGAPNAFYVVASCSLLIGAVWLGLMAPRILALQRQPLSVWRAADDDGQDALKTK